MSYPVNKEYGFSLIELVGYEIKTDLSRRCPIFRENFLDEKELLYVTYSGFHYTHSANKIFLVFQALNICSNRFQPIRVLVTTSALFLSREKIHVVLDC